MLDCLAAANAPLFPLYVFTCGLGATLGFPKAREAPFRAASRALCGGLDEASASCCCWTAGGIGEAGRLLFMRPSGWRSRWCGLRQGAVVPAGHLDDEGERERTDGCWRVDELLMEQGPSKAKGREAFRLGPGAWRWQ